MSIMQEPKNDTNTTSQHTHSPFVAHSGQPATNIGQYSVAPLKFISMITVRKLLRGQYLAYAPGLIRDLSSVIRCITTENICNINNAPASYALAYLSKKHLCVLAGGYVAHKLGLTRYHADIDIYVFVHQKDLDGVFQQSIAKIYRRNTDFVTLTPHEYHLPVKYEKVILSNYLTDGKCKVVFIPLNDSNSMLTLYELCTNLVNNFDLDICKCVGIFAHNIGHGLNEGDILYFPLATSTEFVDNNEKRQFVNILSTITNGIHNFDLMDPFYDGNQGLDPDQDGHEFTALYNALKLYIQMSDEYDCNLLRFRMLKNFVENEQIVSGTPKPKDYIFKLANYIKRWCKYNIRVNPWLCMPTTRYQEDLNVTNFFLKNM